ncbi:hypothetical protein ACFFX0_05475 [Citricoccus parietis]|uniref:Uncharacterized protein n=1 Tax=Citricoccus parietis TaxID=592307 RepID=A0ABV5FVF3_9MICC
MAPDPATRPGRWSGRPAGGRSASRGRRRASSIARTARSGPRQCRGEYSFPHSTRRVRSGMADGNVRETVLVDRGSQSPFPRSCVRVFARAREICTKIPQAAEV